LTVSIDAKLNNRFALFGIAHVAYVVAAIANVVVQSCG